MLPAKYLKEIHRIPPQKLNPGDTEFKVRWQTQVFYDMLMLIRQTMLRDYAIATAVSDLPAQAVTKRLNVSLGGCLLPPLKVFLLS